MFNISLSVSNSSELLTLKALYMRCFALVAKLVVEASGATCAGNLGTGTRLGNYLFYFIRDIRFALRKTKIQQQCRVVSLSRRI